MGKLRHFAVQSAVENALSAIRGRLGTSSQAARLGSPAIVESLEDRRLFGFVGEIVVSAGGGIAQTSFSLASAQTYTLKVASSVGITDPAISAGITFQFGRLGAIRSPRWFLH